MKFHAVTSTDADSQTLESEFKASREIGPVRIGENHLFYKRGLKSFFIPYQDITRYFRRVLTTSAQLCCGRGDISVESLVVCTEVGEVCDLPLPSSNAARILMDELKEKMPETACVAPKKTDPEEV